MLALLAKTAVGFLPVTLLLVVWWKQERVRPSDLFALAPMVACALSTGLITLYVEHHSGGAIGPQFAIPFLDRVLISGRSFWFYLGKLAFPYPLIFLYERFTIDARQAIQWVYPAATAALLAVLYAARHRIGKGVFVAAAHFYLGTSALIFIVVTYMTRYSFVADHWQYFGAMSATALAGAALAMLTLRASGARRVVMYAVAALALTSLAAATRRQTADYKNGETLYRAILARNPRSWMACDNLAVILTRTGRNDEALVLLYEALRLKPDYAEAHLNLGNALAAAGQPEAALPHFAEAMRLVPEFGKQAQFNIGNVLTKTGRIDEAIGHYEDALRYDTNAADVHNNFGYVLSLKGRYGEAIEHYERALRLQPDFPQARSNLANAHNDLGVALAHSNRIAEARAEWEQALRFEPNFQPARDNLAGAEALSRRDQ